jgi:type II secretory pathway predicted ATPase ExeA
MDDVRAALRRRDGVIVVTGGAGTGKTMLCRTLLQEVDDAAFVSLALDPSLSAEAMLAHILSDFGVIREQIPSGRPQLSAALQRFLRSLRTMNGYALVVVDEAHLVSDIVLEQLRLLVNFDRGATRVLQVVLVGRPELTGRLRTRSLRALEQSIGCRSELAPLSRYEAERYLERRLSAAQLLDGGWQRAFTPPAARAVASLSGGVPAVINRVCDIALEIGAERRVSVIDTAVVRAAARRMDVDAGRRRWPVIAGAAAVFTVAIGTGMTWASLRDVPALPPAPQARAAAASALLPPTAVEVDAKLPLAESFNVMLGSFRSGERAAAVAAQVQAWGVPAFADERDAGSHQVVAGPYATRDEAEEVRRGVAAHGFAASSVFTQTPQPVAGAIDASPGTRPRLLSSRNRVSVVLELTTEPGKVMTRPAGPSAIAIDAGPARARVSLQGLDGGNVRVAGRRVYVDFAPLPMRSAPAAAAAAAEPIAPALERFQRLQPFLRSARTAPTPEVIAVLTATLQDLAASLQRMHVADTEQSAREQLLATVVETQREISSLRAAGTSGL